MKIFLTILAMIGFVVAMLAAMFIVGLILAGIDELRNKYYWVKRFQGLLKKIGDILVIVFGVLLLIIIAIGGFVAMYAKLWGAS